MPTPIQLPPTTDPWGVKIIKTLDDFCRSVLTELRSLRWTVDYVTYSGSTPVGNVTPEFIGQELLLDDSGTKTWWKSIGLTDTDWIQL